MGIAAIESIAAIGRRGHDATPAYAVEGCQIEVNSIATSVLGMALVNRASMPSGLHRYLSGRNA